MNKQHTIGFQNNLYWMMNVYTQFQFLIMLSEKALLTLLGVLSQSLLENRQEREVRLEKVNRSR